MDPAMTEERITDPTTGGQKGRKPERFELLAWGFLEELSRVAAFGARKYADHNWLKGYAWSLNIGAAFRHLTRWVRGESIDPESGCSHLAHLAWHCMALYTFELTQLGTDDRATLLHYDAEL